MSLHFWVQADRADPRHSRAAMWWFWHVVFQCLIMSNDCGFTLLPLKGHTASLTSLCLLFQRVVVVGPINTSSFFFLLFIIFEINKYFTHPLRLVTLFPSCYERLSFAILDSILRCCLSFLCNNLHELHFFRKLLLFQVPGKCVSIASSCISIHLFLHVGWLWDGVTFILG